MRRRLRFERFTRLLAGERGFDDEPLVVAQTHTGVFLPLLDEIAERGSRGRTRLLIRRRLRRHRRLGRRGGRGRRRVRGRRQRGGGRRLRRARLRGRGRTGSRWQRRSASPGRSRHRLSPASSGSGRRRGRRIERHGREPLRDRLIHIGIRDRHTDPGKPSSTIWSSVIVCKRRRVYRGAADVR